jgi:hypothetical protein
MGPTRALPSLVTEAQLILAGADYGRLDHHFGARRP